MSKSTFDAWKSTDHKVTFTAPSRDLDTVIPLAVTRGYTDVINLGHRKFPHVEGDLRVWNPAEAVRAVSWPASLRETMPDFLPTLGWKGPHWHKRPGWGGDNKIFHSECCPAIYQPAKHEDIQIHVLGTEYRINTVGDKIIQAHKKFGEPGNFEWEWCGVSSLKGTGILPTIKKAVRLVPSFENTILGWDVIHDGEHTYILEVNTSMGVNEATVARIMEVMNE